MLYIYYAIVAEAPTHGMRGNPTIIIRVMRKNAAQQWTQISDTLAYYITTTPTSIADYNPCDYMTAITPQPLGVQGWHTAQGTSVYYKDWEKVALNLSPLYGDSVRIEVITYDCTANYHYAYAYLCGECRPMVISTVQDSLSGTTLHAPRSLRSYFWQASEFGVVDPVINVTNPEYNYVTFRDLSSHTADSTEAAGAQSYHVQANDFKIYKRRTPQGNIITLNPPEVGNQQTFRCRMISALDPDKPIVSYMYANVSALFSEQDTTPVIDTIIIHDTLIVHDTLYIDVPYAVHDTTYINVYVHDTTTVTDTLWLTQYDTVWMTHYDTIIIHDTVYLPNSIDGAEMVNAKIYASQGQIVVEGAEGYPVTLYDAIGRELSVNRKMDGNKRCFTVPQTGVYLIKIGTLPAHRIVVIK